MKHVIASAQNKHVITWSYLNATEEADNGEL